MSYTKKFAIVFVVLAALLGLYDLVNMTASAHSDSKGQTISVGNAKPVSLIGKWHQTSGPDGITMSAEITDSAIQINMQLGRTNGIFWLGTFDTSVSASGSDAIISRGDQDAMALEIFASSEKSKIFAYDNGDLSFQFSMRGVPSTLIHLSRGAK